MALLVFGGIAFTATTSTGTGLDAYVENPILGCDQINPLADGSWVYIIGSADSVIDPMQSWNGGYIAGSVTGDDVILGITQITSGPEAFGAGTFLTSLEYDSGVINYVYIRVFDTTGPLTGEICWGESDMFEPDPIFGVAAVDFGTVNVTNTDTFYIIPEPTTANLIVLVGGMIWAMKASIGRKKKKKTEPGDERDT